MKDFEAWYQYLLTRDDVDPDRIGAFAESMGGALAIKYASKNENIKALVTHCAFSSIEDAVEVGVRHFTGLPAFPFAPMILFWAEHEAGFTASEVDAKVWIKGMCGRPVFILQGGKDDHAPPESGQWLYDAACEPKEYWFEPEAGHIGLDDPDVVPAGVYETRVVSIFDQHVLGQ